MTAVRFNLALILPSFLVSHFRQDKDIIMSISR